MWPAVEALLKGVGITSVLQLVNYTESRYPVATNMFVASMHSVELHALAPVWLALQRAGRLQKMTWVELGDTLPVHAPRVVMQGCYRVSTRAELRPGDCLSRAETRRRFNMQLVQTCSWVRRLEPLLHPPPLELIGTAVANDLFSMEGLTEVLDFTSGLTGSFEYHRRQRATMQSAAQVGIVRQSNPDALPHARAAPTASPTREPECGPLDSGGTKGACPGGLP